MILSCLTSVALDNFSIKIYIFHFVVDQKLGLYSNILYKYTVIIYGVAIDLVITMKYFNTNINIQSYLNCVIYKLYNCKYVHIHTVYACMREIQCS